MLIVKPSATLVWITQASEIWIEQIARTCYKSENQITENSHIEFIRMLINKGHHAMLEHAGASIKFVCDRGVSHELVRHRLCAYAQESTRYCNYSKEKFGSQITVIEPPFEKEIQRVTWQQACEDSEKMYFYLLDKGTSPQIARSVLPNSLKTEIVCTANMREWRHIFNLRLAQSAHPQMREVMMMAYEILKTEAPTIFEDIQT